MMHGRKNIKLLVL